MTEIFIVGKTYLKSDVKNYATFLYYDSRKKRMIYVQGISRLPFKKEGEDKLKYLGMFPDKERVNDK